VDENSPNGTIVGTVVATDPDAGDSLTFSISGGSGQTAFSIDAATGQISVAESSQLDFETTASFSLEVQVTDLGGNPASPTITVNLNDINEDPVVLLPPPSSVDENSPIGTIVGAVVATDPDAGDSLTFTISGGSGSQAFSIDAVTGQITVADSTQLDFESTESFSLEVRVTDLGGNSASATITVNLNVIGEEG
jgi:VCBS repeat-containing protein